MQKIIGFISTIFYCIKLSFKTSILYSIIRFSSCIIAPIISICSAYILKILLDKLSLPTQDITSRKIFLLHLAIYFAFGIFMIIINKFNTYVSSLHNEKIQSIVKIDMIDKGVNADIELFDSANSYNQFCSVVRDSCSLCNVLWTVIDGVSCVVSFVGAFSMLCGINIIYSLLLTLLAIPAAIAQNRFTRLVYNLGLEQIGPQRECDYIYAISTSREFAPATRLFNIGDYLKNKYRNIWLTLFSKKKALLKRQVLILTGLQLLPEIFSLFIIVEISFMIFANKNTVGDFSLYTQMVSHLNTSVFMVINALMLIAEDQLRIDNVKRFEKLPKKIDCDGNLSLKHIKNIAFCNVSFKYPGTEVLILQNVSFHLEAPEKICLVGANGSGKSTIIKLLLRFYDIAEGTIKVNGINIKEYTVLSLRSMFSAYFQNEINFAFTIRDNIFLGDIKIKDEKKLANSLFLSGAANIVNKSIKGLDASLSRNYEIDGMELSGGEQQKIALARTFYRRCSCMLLDEPSSALDPEAENNLFEKLKVLFDNKLTILTSHRLSNVFMADRIIVLEKGRIVEIGTLKELFDNKGRFSVLYNYQASKFSKSYKK